MNWKKKMHLKNVLIYNHWDGKKLNLSDIQHCLKMRQILNMSKKIAWKKRGQLSRSCYPLVDVMKKSEETYTWPLSEEGRRSPTLASSEWKMVISRVYFCIQVGNV